MVANLMLLRSHSFSFSLLLSPPRFLLNPSISTHTFSFSTSTSTSAATNSISSCSTLPYGPSLHKGHKPSKPHINPISQQKLQHQEVDDNDQSDLLDEDNFTRVFDVAALRVPSNHCFALENRLRGHLLNWPRIRNVARVPGDEMEDGFKNFLISSNSGSANGDRDSSVTLNRRIYGKAEGDGELLSPVLYRDKLARTFDSRGFVKFRNLAKLSRPKKRKQKEVVEEKDRRGKKGIGKNEVYLVEVEEEESELEGDDMTGLLGDEFKGRKWRGSTRLLLLDEQYANAEVEKMPEAIKVSVPTL